MKFMNIWKYGAAFDGRLMDKEAGGEGGGGAGGAGGEGEGEGEKPFKSFASQKELDDYIASNKPAGDELSITEKRQQQEKQQREQQQKTNDIQIAVVFDNNFDSLIEKNADLFPESTKTIRKDVKSDNLVERANLIAATAAKEYFSIPANLETLTTADQERVQSEILGVRFESQIDGLKAWEIVERSLNGHELANKYKKANDFTGKGGTGETGHKNVDKYLKGFFPESVVSVPN